MKQKMAASAAVNRYSRMITRLVNGDKQEIEQSERAHLRESAMP